VQTIEERKDGPKEQKEPNSDGKKHNEGNEGKDHEQKRRQHEDQEPVEVLFQGALLIILVLCLGM
jgi:hypothetical protein